MDTADSANESQIPDSRFDRRDIGKWGAFSDSWRASGLRGGDLKPRADEDLSSPVARFSEEKFLKWRLSVGVSGSCFSRAAI